MDSIKQYINLRSSLLQEKAQLEERLRQINEALGESASRGEGAMVGVTGPSTGARAPQGAPARRGRPSPGGLSLRDAVIQVTSSQPLTKQEILDAVQKLGYRFSTKNPLNSLGVILYGKNPRFKNEQGRFSPSGGTAATAGRPQNPQGANGTSGAFARKKRELSPEARERIAAAQRARWAKAKGR